MTLPEKINFFKQLYATQGGTFVFVHRDVKGVVLPDGLKEYVLLEFRRGMPIPIRNLVIHPEAGLKATLSFNQMPFDVVLPWNAVFAMSDITGNGIMYDETKVSLFMQCLKEKRLQPTKLSMKPKKAASPFVVLDGERKGNHNNENEERPATHLRLVK